MKKNQRGQALIELIIFLPLMFTLYSIISGFAGAINGSINQQKATRAYAFYINQNSSNFPNPGSMGPEMQKSGQNVVGWKSKLDGTAPLMPCYRISLPTKGSKSENCDESYSEQTTQNIRVGTVFGLCGGTYARQGNFVTLVPNGTAYSFKQAYDVDSCLIK
jgi:hypothetical protein